MSDVMIRMKAPTIREIFEWYRESETREGLSQVGHKERELQRAHFCAFNDGGPLPYGDRPYAKFRPFHLLRFIKSQKGARSAWTKRRIASSIHAAMNAAVRLGFIRRNPFWGLRLPMGKTGRDWTEEEYRTILRCSGPWFRRLVVFIRHTGTRQGEARSLEWSHINLSDRLITLREHKTAAVTGEARKIRLNTVAAKLLIWIWRHRGPSLYVFTNMAGKRWTRGALTKHLRAVRRRSGLSEEVRLHGGRHTFVTRGLTNGVALATIAALVGTRTINPTQRYVHLVNKAQHLQQAVEKATGGQIGELAALPEFERIEPSPKAPQGKTSPRPSWRPRGKGPKLWTTQEQAWAAYQWALGTEPRLALATDATVWAWIRSRTDCRHRMPSSFETWARYLSVARRFYRRPKSGHEAAEMPRAVLGQPAMCTGGPQP